MSYRAENGRPQRCGIVSPAWGNPPQLQQLLWQSHGPAGATELKFHQERGADPAIWVRMRILPGARGAFLSDAGYLLALSSERRYVRSAQLASASWWRPDEIAQFESGHLLRDKGRPRYGSNLLLSSGSDPITVYVFVTGL